MITYTIYPIPYEVRGLEYLNLLHKYVEKDTSNGAVFQIKKFSWTKLLFGFRSKNERRIVHIHWETNIYGSEYAVISIIRMVYRFLGLRLLKLRGVKIVWTMHNLRAHDYPHPFVDAIGRELTRCLSDAVVIQEKTFASEEARRRPSARIVFIPQGNYVGVYGQLWRGDRNQLRESYDIKTGEIILLALGSVRPYKALPVLMKIVSEARRQGAPVRLFIFGKTSEKYERTIREEADKTEAVTLHLGFVPDHKIPEVLALADYSIFYYEDSSLNSAAMMLSLSYGTPVIIRKIPASEIITKQNGLVFQTAEELKNILLSLASVQPFDHNAIIDTVAHQDWPTVASKLCRLYNELF